MTTINESYEMPNRTTIHQRRRRMSLLRALLIGLVASTGVLSEAGHAAAVDLDQMPPQLESRFALSALPPALRDKATVYLLDPHKGYELSRHGTSGLACLVQRTVWELADFRNDIYIPLCYDAAGAATYLRVILDTAKLRAEGSDPAALHAEIERRYRDKNYNVPEKAGLSYMVAPIMRTIGPPDMKVHTMAMPHFMFYAPGLTNSDIGAVPDLGKRESLMNPFIDKQGTPEQSYLIQMVGEAEARKIHASEKRLVADLCAYREILCLARMKH
ncbi:MAG: hypothetical protein JWR21_1388 [Herminiimonas sp.]|nr:hypothetical protein [Herminiimonas sp.]MDB5852573.1 hypothetical protein [Herminiimonas sp.]